MKLFNRGGYEQRVYYIPEKKLITKIDCTCVDFTIRRIKRVGEFADTKYVAEPCKHLRDIVKLFEIYGFKMKTIKKEGKDKLTAEVKREVIIRSQMICELCKQAEAENYHRIQRGANGGTYTPDNILHLCLDCHKSVHGKCFQQ